jgi:Predicted RNA-binding protein containing a PIN domain
LKEYLVIDGYNIINAWQELKAIARTDLEGARDRLVEIMLEYSAFSGVEVIIVFDAYRVKGGSEVEIKHPRVTVVYTKENQTADSYIEKVIGELGQIFAYTCCDERRRAAADSAWQRQCQAYSPRARNTHTKFQGQHKKRTRDPVTKMTLADRLKDFDEEAFLKLENMRKKG